MILEGNFEFVSMQKRIIEEKQYTYVNILDPEGEVRTFRTLEYIPDMLMGDKCKAVFKVFKAKDGGFVVSLQKLDPIV